MNWASRSQDTQITFSLDIAYQNLTSTNPPAARYNGFQQVKPYPAMKEAHTMNADPNENPVFTQNYRNRYTG